MKLDDYINKQIKFLEEQLQDAKKEKASKAIYLIEAKISELQSMSRAVGKKIIDKI